MRFPVAAVIFTVGVVTLLVTLPDSLLMPRDAAAFRALLRGAAESELMAAGVQSSHGARRTAGPGHMESARSLSVWTQSDSM
jgi:hypothetical protein